MTTQSTQALRQRFDSIELSRAMAAILVVFYHTARIAAEPRFWGAVAFSGQLANFNVGVDFFFVLSGFIITWVHHADIGRPDRLGRYARKRFLRIYPPYWAVMVPLAVMYAMHPGTGDPSDHDPMNVLRSLVLWPSTVQPVLGVAWTLSYEIFFYGVFAGLIVIGRPGLWFLPLWGVTILAGQVFAPLSFPFSFVFSPYILEFLMGVACAIVIRPRPTFPSSWLIPVGALAFGVALFVPHIQDPALLGRLIFGSASTLMLAGMVGAHARGKIVLPRQLLLLGAASYAIYLVHPAALSILCQVIIRLGGRHLPPDVAVMILALLAIGLGIAFHVMIEKRMMTLAARCLGHAGRKGQA